MTHVIILISTCPAIELGLLKSPKFLAANRVRLFFFGPLQRDLSYPLILHSYYSVNIFIRLYKKGSPALELCDGNGAARLIADHNEYGSPSLTLRDGNHTSRLELEISVD